MIIPRCVSLPGAGEIQPARRRKAITSPKSTAREARFATERAEYVVKNRDDIMLSLERKSGRSATGALSRRGRGRCGLCTACETRPGPAPSPLAPHAGTATRAATATSASGASRWSGAVSVRRASLLGAPCPTLSFSASRARCGSQAPPAPCRPRAPPASHRVPRGSPCVGAASPLQALTPSRDRAWGDGRFSRERAFPEEYVE